MIAAYTKEYLGNYEKQYEKTYGNAWSGPGYGNAYLGLAHFTNNYVGERTFHQTYIGVATTNSAAQSTAAGNLTINPRIKVDGEWKSIIRTRKKIDGEWKIIQSTKIKEDNQYKTVANDHERIDINITSNTANFVLGTELTNLGFSLYDKPKQVNVNIAKNVFVYSATTSPAFDTSFLTGAQGATHKVKILLQEGAHIVGKSGLPGVRYSASNLGLDGSDGGNAILLRDGVELFIESYGTIAGGGGGGGSGGYPADTNNVDDASDPVYGKIGGAGGYGAGWDATLGWISESDSDRNGSTGSYNYGIHGGDGGLLGQLGTGAGGFTADNSSQSEVNPGTQYSQYDMSGHGGKPGSAIKGYDASRVTFINSTESSVWGDSAFKFKA